jgi:hypothetical protein
LRCGFDSEKWLAHGKEITLFRRNVKRFERNLLGAASNAIDQSARAFDTSNAAAVALDSALAVANDFLMRRFHYVYLTLFRAKCQMISFADCGENSICPARSSISSG